MDSKSGEDHYARDHGREGNEGRGGRRIRRISRKRRNEQIQHILQSCKRTREVDDNEKRMDDIKRRNGKGRATLTIEYESSPNRMEEMHENQEDSLTPTPPPPPAAPCISATLHLQRKYRLRRE
jgi:hypothetical protein